MIIITAVIPEWSTSSSPRVSLVDTGWTWNWDEKRWSGREPNETYQTPAYRPKMTRSGSPAHQSVFYLREPLLPEFNAVTETWRGYLSPAWALRPFRNPTRI
jgi:hypothetical protein